MLDLSRGLRLLSPLCSIHPILSVFAIINFTAVCSVCIRSAQLGAYGYKARADFYFPSVAVIKNFIQSKQDLVFIICTSTLLFTFWFIDCSQLKQLCQVVP